MEPWNEDGDSKFSTFDWSLASERPSPALKYWAERQLDEATRATYFHRFRPKPAPRPWWRRLWSKTRRLREALRGLRMGWRGELG